MPIATPRGADASQVQRLGNRPDSHHASGLQIARHGQHVGGEGIGTASGSPSGLRFGEVGGLPQRDVSNR